ncbi:MAG: hypothetical protein AB7I27_14435 [Bacteriovoracaceae bacterium]
MKGFFILFIALFISFQSMAKNYRCEKVQLKLIIASVVLDQAMKDYKFAIISGEINPKTDAIQKANLEARVVLERFKKSQCMNHNKGLNQKIIQHEQDKERTYQIDKEAKDKTYKEALALSADLSFATSLIER